MRGTYSTGIRAIDSLHHIVEQVDIYGLIEIQKLLHVYQVGALLLDVRRGRTTRRTVKGQFLSTPCCIGPVNNQSLIISMLLHAESIIVIMQHILFFTNKRSRC